MEPFITQRNIFCFCFLAYAYFILAHVNVRMHTNQLFLNDLHKFSYNYMPLHIGRFMYTTSHSTSTRRLFEILFPLTMLCPFV